MRTGALEGGQQPENDAGEKSDKKCKSQDAPVELEIVEIRGERNSPNRIKRGQKREQPVGKKQSSHAAKQGQKHALSKKLPNETPASGAERATEREFPFACDAARQLQIRHVRTTDQQKKSNSRHKREQRLAHTTFQIAKQILTKRDRFHVRIGLLQTDTWFEPRHNRVARRRALDQRQSVDVDLKRYPNFRDAWE